MKRGQDNRRSKNSYSRNQKKKSSSVPDLRNVVSRKDAIAVTMNMSGRSGLGMTPRYKIDMVKNYLKSVPPDVIVVQDAIDVSDIASVLDTIDQSYDWHFRPDHSKMSPDEIEQESNSDDGNRCITGLIWNKEKYRGTPLKIDDQRLSEFTPWLKKHNIVIVKLDSMQRSNNGTEDVYPSFVAISWHGPDYGIALRQRMIICEQFFRFLSLLRKNNWFVPILIGGDFNIDLKSYDLEKHSEYLYVPYRPISGSLAKDLKNTFLFTVDSLQITETSFKQFHPDIYPSPFITVRLRGRTKIKLWAVVRIQRSIRAFLRRVKDKRHGQKKLKESKKRWRKKIEGENYVSDPETEEEIEHPSVSPTKINSSDDSRKVSGNSLYDSEPLSITVGNHRRKRYSDLKSVHEKKEEMKVNESLMRTFKKSERFDF